MCCNLYFERFYPKVLWVFSLNLCMALKNISEFTSFSSWLLESAISTEENKTKVLCTIKIKSINETRIQLVFPRVCLCQVIFFLKKGLFPKLIYKNSSDFQHSLYIRAQTSLGWGRGAKEGYCCCLALK